MDEDGSNTTQSEEPAPIIYVAEHESQRSYAVTQEVQARSQALGYDVMTAPITTTRFQSKILTKLEDFVSSLRSQHGRDSDVPWPQIPSLSPEDTDLEPGDGNGASLIGVVSPWIDLGSKDPLIANISQQVFCREIAYAAFCGLSNIIVPGPLLGSDSVQYGRAILEGIGLGPYIQLHLLIPMTGELELEGTDGTHLSQLVRKQFLSESDEDIDETEPELFNAWETWDVVRAICSYSNKVSIALEVPRHLPDLSLQSRWYSECVRLLVLPRTSFLRNAKGYPVLSKDHQAYISRLVKLRFPPWIVLADVESLESPNTSASTTTSVDPTPAEAATGRNTPPNESASHLRYIRHLQYSQPPRPPIERFGQGYQDYVQSPLQPLTDNLESITYEVFEKDPIKYEWYKRAIAEALKDLHNTKVKNGKPINLAVVGAGRGPLVTRALQASQETGVPIRCFAVEKNPNAHVLLQRRNARDPLWNNRVTVVRSDMRSWPGPPVDDALQQYDKVDILVSELLGSFADNELSPECLDGVQHVLHPEHGINIPQRYSAHCTPIATPRLHADLLGRPGDDKWEIPSVVMLQQFDFLCNVATSTSSEADRAQNITPDVQEVWSFSHPVPPRILATSLPEGESRVNNAHNMRTSKLVFNAANRGVCHGLAGYFETVLYASPHKDGKTIELSINPVTMEAKSAEMISWFPIWFPLKAPLHIPDDSEVEVSMWRRTDDRKVWYEWIVEVFATAFDGNGSKKRSKVARSDLHSSWKNGCLM